MWDFNLRAMDLVDFKDKKVLDVACRDGLFSFEAERRGARQVIGYRTKQKHCGEAHGAGRTPGGPKARVRRRCPNNSPLHCFPGGVEAVNAIPILGKPLVLNRNIFMVCEELPVHSWGRTPDPWFESSQPVLDRLHKA
jgi:hypothetical protein